MQGYLGQWLASAATMCCLAGSAARADDWPAWRGPLGTGVLRAGERLPPRAWDARHNVRWHVPLPDRGNSTPVVSDGCVFVTQVIEKDNRRTVLCYSRTHGRLLWQSGMTAAAREPTNGQNPYCSASPVTDGRHVVA